MEILKSDCSRIGISIYSNHRDPFRFAHSLKRLSQDLANHLFPMGATIIYGGYFRKDGFPQFLIDQAIELKTRLNSITDSIHVENHMAWPLYISSYSETVAWRIKYNGIVKTIEHDIPDDVAKSINKSYFLAPITTYDKYIWSRCLTEMREKSIELSHARICAGGELEDYRGKMPRALEEIIISIEKNKPIFLLGAFGGVVAEVCKTITTKSIAEPITERWQIENNPGYFELQEKAKNANHHADYTKIKTFLEGISVDNLASSSGLNSNDYLRLMESPFVDECVHLVLKGLRTLSDARDA